MFTPTLRTAFLLLASATVSLGQVADILANTATFKPKVTVADTYGERVLVEVDGDSIYRSVIPNSERIAVTVTANLDGADPGVIDESTFVEISIGNFDHSGSLGDSLDFKPGLKRATFPLNKEVYLANGDSREVRVGAVIYAWTAKLLTVTVTCTDIDGAGVSDVAASNYVGSADPGSAVAITDDPIDVLVTFGDAVGERTAYLRGISRTVTQYYGSVAAGTDESFDLSNVTIQGTADITGPVVKSTFPLKPTTLNTIDITGSADDITEVSLDSITVNGVATAASSVAIADPDGDGIWTWNVTKLPLKKGVNAVVLTFSDTDGNETKVTKSYTIK